MHAGRPLEKCHSKSDQTYIIMDRSLRDELLLEGFNTLPALRTAASKKGTCRTA